MTRRAALLRAAAVAALTFAVTLSVLLLTSDDESSEPVARPADARELVGLAQQHLQSARETGDPGAYERADAALRRALRLAPRDPAALTERGVLKLARHDFRGALVDARAARAAAPEVNKPFGVLVDSLVELGRYGEAGRALQQMVDRKPGLDAYARVSYLRELRGDLAGAERALRLAISAGGAVPENTAYVTALAGDLDLVRGRPAVAMRSYRAALQLVPGYAPALYGLARSEASLGRLDSAIRRLRGLVERLPSPSYTIALGEAELAAGRPAAAKRDLALVRAQEQLLRGAGVSSDVEVALFEADHGSPERGVAIAQRAWNAAPGVRSADALGWALTRAGEPRDGLRMARRALEVGTREPLFLYHAGVAASRAGDRGLARRLLRRVDPRFSPYHGPRAARELEALR